MVRMDGMNVLLEQANQALGRLDGLSELLPDLNIFLYTYIRKEALLSSQIEGTQSSLTDLLVHENSLAPGVPIDDVQEVSNYVSAMNYGLARLERMPLSLRLMREIHGHLLSAGRGSDKTPGDFRYTQNWIGGTRPGNANFVPPPPEEVLPCLSNLEKFIHDSNDVPILIKAGLVHVQFETIHPFLDGNGRLGRLLITFLLCASGALRQPMLYLSLYLKTHRSTYYELLNRVRATGDWESWIEFFLRGVKDTAEQAVQSARRMLALFAQDRQIVTENVGRAVGSVLQLLHFSQSRPVFNISQAAIKTGLSQPTIINAIAELEKLGIFTELTGKKRDRVFAYRAYLDILNEGTDPLPPE